MEKTIEFLRQLRAEFLAAVAQGQSPKEVSETMGTRVFQAGMFTLDTASMSMCSTNIGLAAHSAAESGASSVLAAAAPGPIGLIITGVIFTAQTGIDYRKFKRGEITKQEFKRRTKRGAFAATGSIVGTTGGMIGGFFAGQLLIPIPVVGGLIGTVVGGFAGGYTGSKVSTKLYDSIEEKMAKSQEQADQKARE